MRENLPLVHYVARRFRDRGAEYDDLFSCGCMGLMKAVDRFDPSFGVRFSTYAVPVIMGEVRRFLRDEGPVHISRNIHDNAVKVEKCREAFVKANGVEPTLTDIECATGLCGEDALLALGARQRVRSLNEPVGGDGETRLMDVLGRDDTDKVDQRLTLSALLRDLTPRERMLIVRRYFKSHTQTQIARDMGVSQVQVSRMEKRILGQLRQRAQGE